MAGRIDTITIGKRKKYSDRMGRCLLKYLFTVICIVVIVTLMLAILSCNSKNNLHVDELLPAENDTYEQRKNDFYETNMYERQMTDFYAPTYNVSFVHSTDLLSIEDTPWANEFFLYILQVADMHDKDLQDKVNESIIEAMTGWIIPGTLWSNDGISPLDGEPLYNHTFTIELQTDRFLSFSNSYDVVHPRRADNLIDVITIDMQTGERIMLDDLVHINVELANKIVEDTTLFTWQVISNPEELLERLQEATQTNKQIYTEKQPFGFSSLMFRTSFHLQKNRLIISFHSDGGLYLYEIAQIIIPLDCISEFLKVSEW